MQQDVPCRLDHVQLIWGSSKVKGSHCSHTGGKQRMAASSDMCGWELAQSHWEAPIQTQ